VIDLALTMLTSRLGARSSRLHENRALERRLRLKGRIHMCTITVKDGTTICSKDRGNALVVTLSHGWAPDGWERILAIQSGCATPVMAQFVYDKVSTGAMPPDKPRPAEWVTLFKQWMDEACRQ
jgi:hypothetical protein